ncbi:MAG TPA: glycosyltransferase family 4 protein [Candidatus Binataceae bacterium]
MRILFVSAEYPPESDWGGIAFYVACLAKALTRRRHEVHVLSCFAGQAPSDTVDEGVFVHRRPSVRLPGLGRVGTITGFRRSAAALIAGLSTFFQYRKLRVNFDLIEYPEWGAEGWLFALIRSVPTVAQLHVGTDLIQRHNRFTTAWDARLASAAERFSIRRSDLVVSSSELLVRELRAAGWFTRVEPEILPNPIDLDKWAEAAPISQTSSVVLFCGRLEPLKAPETLIRAVAILRKELPELRAIFAGRSALTRDGVPEFDWVSGGLDLSGCEFVGQVARDQLPNLVATARVLAVPSRFESFSMAALEAMAASRPVVVTSTTGIAELVRANSAGAVVPPDDPAALAEALRPFLKDAHQAENAGRRARVAAETLGADQIAAAREDLYRRAIFNYHERIGKLRPAIHTLSGGRGAA